MYGRHESLIRSRARDYDQEPPENYRNARFVCCGAAAAAQKSTAGASLKDLNSRMRQQLVNATSFQQLQYFSLPTAGLSLYLYRTGKPREVTRSRRLPPQPHREIIS